MAKRKLKADNDVRNAKTAQSTEQPRKIIKFAPKTINQAKLLKAIEDENTHIVFAMGPAGVGKSFIVAKYAVQQLMNGDIEKIMITRPTVATGENIGYLPGTLAEKMEPWLLPIFDVFMEQGGLTKNDIKNLMAKGTIEIAPFQFMRGRSIRNAIVIADEMQNSDPNQMKMLLTRIAEGSKILLTGDLEQSDKSWRNHTNGLQDFLNRFMSYHEDRTGIEVVQFSRQDVIRHPIVDKILHIYD